MGKGKGEMGIQPVFQELARHTCPRWLPAPRAALKAQKPADIPVWRVVTACAGRSCLLGKHCSGFFLYFSSNKPFPAAVHITLNKASQCC